MGPPWIDERLWLAGPLLPPISQYTLQAWRALPVLLVL